MNNCFCSFVGEICFCYVDKDELCDFDGKCICSINSVNLSLRELTWWRWRAEEQPDESSKSLHEDASWGAAAVLIGHIDQRGFKHHRNEFVCLFCDTDNKNNHLWVIFILFKLTRLYKRRHYCNNDQYCWKDSRLLCLGLFSSSKITVKQDI